MEQFSHQQRPDIIKRYESTSYDLIIIGGGITGAGIALDAASRGMKTALVEKNDFASGTSSKSTKLIHGGLRYLKQFQFKMVADVGRERKIVHKLAPHLVLPEKMLLPVLSDSSMGMFSISIGLKMYDFLAGVKGDDRRKMLGKKKTLITEPLLPDEKLKGSGLYAEYRTDDARLTIELIKSAFQYGADCLNYLEVKDLLYDNKEINGIVCHDHLDGKTVSIKGKYIINAAGPWVDDLRKINNSKKGKHLFLSKGIHLVVDRKKLPVQHSIYFEIEDGRMVFIIPRDQSTYFGTTDTPYSEDKDIINIDLKDVKYLVDAINSMFPSIKLKIEDIKSSWAGLRPLIHEEGKSASEISRKDEIFTSSTGLISIAGGKLTGYRKMAVKIVNLVNNKINKKYNKKYGNSETLKIPLCGNSFTNYNDVTVYIDKISNSLKKLEISTDYASYLVHNYGIQTDSIIKNISGSGSSNGELDLLRSELDHCINFEMVYKPLDFLERRTGRLYFWSDSIENCVSEILTVFKNKFNWTDKKYKIEEKILFDKMSQIRNFIDLK